MGSMMNFEDLVKVEAGEPLTTTLHIAEWTGVKHKNVLETVRKYTKQLSLFGRVAFETRPFETTGGVQEREIALLNEGQSTLLIALMRNTDRVIDFKCALVKAFLAARNLITTDYMSLAKQHAVLSEKLESERELASFSGYSLSVWKQKSKRLKAAIEEVQQQMQPCLCFD